MTTCTFMCTGTWQGKPVGECRGKSFLIPLTQKISPFLLPGYHIYVGKLDIPVSFCIVSKFQAAECQNLEEGVEFLSLVLAVTPTVGDQFLSLVYTGRDGKPSPCSTLVVSFTVLVALEQMLCPHCVCYRMLTGNAHRKIFKSLP